MQRITDYLLADHQRLCRLLGDAVAGPQFDAEVFGEFRAGLLRHIGIEEKILFPAAKRVGAGALLARLSELRLEHGVLTSLLVPTPDAALAGELARLLETHDAMEEGPHGVYEACEALVGADQSAVLLARAQAAGPVPLMPHHDGPGTVRTVREALAIRGRTGVKT